MKTEDGDTVTLLVTSVVNRVKQFIEGAVIMSMTLFITDAFEGILFMQVDHHSMLHYVIFMLFYMSISFLYYKYKPM
ncbi:uncharacterized protein ASPGLDRAFT_46315 [Aspergillus glaucus CBS 516.65]|uniref:Uncharacterized protein n=1 Tax=Aspergillus glaucus CBS 516.65 TaxID=1160497 RepID=A0A1L9VN15_ASPGL|nr:hypothetical protein ASPGLDRAFT_46315 [Aspergillus glaucus CBS 516.65]OJJ85316.1 hypothetical protein ASPGLDRAFT_46315 [Aspergillus glaucus CBS 516.65]